MRIAEQGSYNPDPLLTGTFDEDRRAAGHLGPVLPDDEAVKPEPTQEPPAR